MTTKYTDSEIEARRTVTLQGYRIYDGHIYWIANDDPERGLEEVRIGAAIGTWEDIYWTLSNHQWPTTGPVLCQLCHDAESELGENCLGCQKLLADEDRGEAEREAAEEALDRWDRDRV